MRKTNVLEGGVNTNTSIERRDFMAALGLGTSAALLVGNSIGSASAQSSYSAADAFNFILNLKYLNYRFNRIASFGYFQSPDVSTQQVFSSEIFGGGVGAVGRVSGGHQVPFSDPIVKGISDEFQSEELNHIFLLRRILGAATFVNQPEINLNLGFVEFGRLAGLDPQFGSFDAFLNDTNFLTASLTLEDLLVTAVAGVLPLVRNNEFLDVATGILATNAYHAGIVRTLMAERGLFTQAQRVSDLRDFYDGPSDIDQGIGTAQRVNIVPADANSILVKRTPEQVLSIVYLNPTNRPFGFFTSGLNGTIR